MAGKSKVKDQDAVQQLDPAQEASIREAAKPEKPIVFANISGQPKINIEDAKALTRGLTHPPKIAFILALAQLGSITRACQVVDISRIAVWHWKREDEKFNEAFGRAMDLASDLMEDELMRRACEGVIKPIFQGGKLVGSVRERSDTLLIFGLKGAKPEKYADRQKVEVTDVTERLRNARERVFGRNKKENK